MHAASDAHTVGFMPFLAAGDLLFNAFVLRHRMIDGATQKDAVRELRETSSLSRDAFGADARALSRTVFGRSLGVRELMLQNTAFGAFGRAMSVDAEIECVRAQEVGHTGTALHRLMQSERRKRLTTFSLRSCSKCVVGDIERHGFATWRVLHQMNALDRCPEHGEPLRAELAPAARSDGKHLLWQLMLPCGSSECDSSEKQEAIPLSEGYAAYLKLWLRVFAGDLQVVRPAAWREFIDSLVYRAGGSAQVQQLLEQTVESTWEAPYAQVAKWLDLSGGSSFIAEELASVTQPQDLARRLVVYASAQHAGLVRKEHEQLMLGRMRDPEGGPLIGAGTTRQQAYKELWAIVVNAGYPSALADALFENVRPAEAARMSGLTSAVVINVIKGLPPDLLRALAPLLPSNGANTWLERELSRRSLADVLP